jgi:hypothetical protein
VEGDEALSEFDDGYQIKSDRVQDPGRPTWQESEQRVSEELEWADFKEQPSFIDGQEVPRGTRGSTRPDNYSQKLRLSVDVKNYGLETAEKQSDLVGSIVEQMTDRARHLPKGSRQGVVIDVRGQAVTPNQIAELRTRIVLEADGLVAPDDIVFKTE